MNVLVRKTSRMWWRQSRRGQAGPHFEDDKMKSSRTAPQCDLLEGGATQGSRGPMWLPQAQALPHPNDQY